jgi:hypothetical protein
MTAPQYPAGPYEPDAALSDRRREELIAEIEQAPARLRAAVAGLAPPQLDTKYRNWTVRQIAHHLADSHLNAYARFKLALTEDRPTIKPYDETRWAELTDARTGDLGPTLLLLEGLHARWVRLLRTLTSVQWERTYFHPEAGQAVRLSEALGSYAWHCRHHIGQITWLRQQHGWGS